MDVHTVISLNVSVGIAPILKSDNVWQLRQQTHFIPRCRGSWTSRTSRSSRQAPVGLGRFQYEVVMTRDQHTHTQTKTTAFFLPPAHIPETFFVGIFQNTSLFGFAMALRGFFPLNDCEVSSRRPHTGFFPAKRQASCWWADLDLQKCLTWMK